MGGFRNPLTVEILLKCITNEERLLMKKNIILMLFVLAILGYGCNSEYEDYGGGDAVYMNETTDTTLFSFTYIDDDRYVQEIKINTIGQVYDYDRVVNIKFTLVNAVEGVDIEPLADQYVVKAGENKLAVPIVMIRTEALQKEARIIDMELQENEYFKTYYDYGSSDRITWVKTNRLRQTLIFSEFMDQRPATWNPYMLGTFSQKKFSLICNLMGIPREKFLDSTYMGYRTNYIASYMKRYLAAEKEAGRTVYEEDGVTEMTMGVQA